MTKRALPLILVCIAATLAGFYWLGGVDVELLQTTLATLGIWAPILYVIAYVIATLCLLPSTPLNLSGGALFGLGWGTFWTTIGAMLAAAIAFWLSRTVARSWFQTKLNGQWQQLDQELANGGGFYIFAVRLLPIIPYGLVNFAAGVTQISWRGYLVGTLVGTIPGIFPFVMLGSTGLNAVQTGDVLPVVGALALIGLLVAGSVWWRSRRQAQQRGGANDT